MINKKLLYQFMRVVMLFAFLTISSQLCMSCSSAEYIPEKLESSLHQKIKSVETEEPTADIQFAGKTESDINDKMLNKLKLTGISVESTVKNVFTASGNAASIKRTTLLDFVVYLEIAKKLELK